MISNHIAKVDQIMLSYQSHNLEIHFLVPFWLIPLSSSDCLSGIDQSIAKDKDCDKFHEVKSE